MSRTRSCVGVLTVLLCGACTPSEAPPEPPPPPEVIATTVGPMGGTIHVAGGAVSLSFAAGALAMPTTVRVETTLAQNGEGDLTRVGTVAGVSLLPSPTEALPAPVELSFATAGVPASELRVARLMPTVGEVREGEAPAGLWLPLAHSYAREDGRVAVKTARFSRYAAVRGRASRCVPPEAMLTPPATPAGYRYVGAEVAVNHVYDEARSTVPLSRAHSPRDLVFVRSRTRVASGAVVCDFIVVHRFAPIEPADPVCAVPADLLTPPPTPPGYRYVGYDVVTNFVLTTTTVPLTRAARSTDTTVIRSRTEVRDGVTVCDLIVAHTFELLPDGGAGDGGIADGGIADGGIADGGIADGGIADGGIADGGILDGGIADGGGTCVGASCAACVVPSAMRTPPAAPRGYRYVGTTVVINLMTVETTVPLDRTPRATDLSRVLARTITQDFVTVCDIVVEHLFEPVAHAADGGAGGCVGAACETCVVPPALLTPPPTPNGYRYVGRTVVVNLQTVETTLPTSRRDKPSDHTAIRSHTIVRDGVTVCDIVVGHTFEPIPAGDGGAATPPVCAGAAAGTGCGAGKACDGAGTCETCVVPTAWLTPPPTPDGYRYVGRVVVINFVTTDITIPLDRQTRETDLTVIRSSTLVKNFQTICDIIVAHDFEPISSAAMCVGRPDGAACDDGNACTQTDTCQSGVCVGANPVVCAARGQCYAAGTCEPTTGLCSNPPKAAESPCDDNNTCTQVDVCRKGVCVGTAPQIGLNACYTAHPFLWAANRADNTVSKINTQTGAVVARYLTSPGGGEPSRTAVNQSGSVWVGHYNVPLGETATVVTKIGLAEAGECQDRNGNGVIDTSTGPGDVKPWMGAWGEGVGGAEDECVVVHVPLEHPDATTPTDARMLTVDKEGNLYAGGLTSPAIFKLSGTDGTVLVARDTAHPHAVGTLDGTPTLWTSPPEVPVLQRIDLATLGSTSVPVPHKADSICAGPSVLVMIVLATQLMATQLGLGMRLTDIGIGGTDMAGRRSFGCAEGGLASARQFYVQRRTAELDQILEYPVGPHGDLDTANPRVFTVGPADTQEPPENQGLGLDQAGHLWSARPGALSRVNPQTGAVVSFPIGFTPGPITNESTGFSSRQVAGGCAGLPDGAPCNEGDACTGADRCQSGVCVPGAQLVCTATDQCRQAGTCAPATGRCSAESAKPSGAPCDDVDLCTRSDTCQSGVCVGANPIVCSALDTCHVAGACEPATGECSNPAKADNTPCDDSNVCSANDTCQRGACVGQSLPVLTSCGPSQSCCEDGCNCDDTQYTGAGPNPGTVVNGRVTVAGVGPPANPSVSTPIVWLSGQQGTDTAVVRVDPSTGTPFGPPTLVPGNAAKPSAGAVALDGSQWLGHRDEAEDTGAITQLAPTGGVGCRLKLGTPSAPRFVRALAIDRGGGLWAGIWDQAKLVRLEIDTCRVTTEVTVADEQGSGQPKQLAVSRGGQLFVTSDTGVFQVSTATPYVVTRVAPMPTSGIALAGPSAFFVGSAGSSTVRRYALPTLTPMDIQWPRAQQPGLQSHVVRALTADASGAVYALLAPPTAGPVFVSKYDPAGQYQGSVRLNQMSSGASISVDANQGLWVTGTLSQGQGQYGFAKRTAAIGPDNQGANPGDDQWQFVNPLPNIVLSAVGSELTGLGLRTGTFDNGQLTQWTLPLDWELGHPDYLSWTLSGPAVSFSVTLTQTGRPPLPPAMGPFTMAPVDLRQLLEPGQFQLDVRMTTEAPQFATTVTLRTARAR